MPEGLRDVVAGRARFPAAQDIPRHRHHRAYAVVILSGSMQQVSYAGRFNMQPGHLLVQPTLDCHANRSGPAGVEILRLPWRREAGLGGLFELDEIDEVVRISERDPIAASEKAYRLVSEREPLPAKRDDWEDLLAADLTDDAQGSLGEWAKRIGLALETLSRGFARKYFCTPSQFRLELKTREAWLRLTSSSEALAIVAAHAGFADQAHMTRSIRRMTGHPPGFWRAGRLDLS